MSAAPFMPLYVADYLADTQHLTVEQHGAYFLLLMAMWRSGGRLPSEAAKLARIVRMTPSRWGKIAADVMAFFEVEGGEITQKRLSEELEKASEKNRRRASAGSRGGTAKSLKSKETASSNATAMLYHSSEPLSEREEKRPSVQKRKSDPGRRGTRLPPGWAPSTENRRFARNLGALDSQIDREAQRFVNYWPAKPGAAGLKLDWEATWRNWCLKAAEDGKFSGVPLAKPAKSDPAAAPKPVEDSATWDERRWRRELGYARLVGAWQPAMGPAPGDAGCVAPSDLLRPDDVFVRRALAA